MDSIFLYIESNGIFAILLIVLLINLGKTDVVWEEKWFRKAMILNILVLVADTGTWIFDGRILGGTLWINKIVFCCYYMVTAIFVHVWLVYIIYKLRTRIKKVRLFRTIMFIPMAVACIMAVGSLWTGWLYLFDETGAYIRGDFFMLHTAILWVYFLTAVYWALRALFDRNRNKQMKESMAIIVSVIFPVVGGVFQTLYYGLNMAWTCSSISFVILFIAIQNKQMITDALTGIYNRGCFTKYLEDSMNQHDAEGNLYLVMIDVNKFKHINDTYGHTTGDRALIEVARLLNEQCKKASRQDFLARYGGDEFSIVCKRKNDEDIKVFVEKLHKASEKLKGRCGFDFDITLSIGWARYDATIYPSMEKYISDADDKMYIQKRSM